jgi:hypothetical protein
VFLDAVDAYFATVRCIVRSRAPNGSECMQTTATSSGASSANAMAASLQSLALTTTPSATSIATCTEEENEEEGGDGEDTYRERKYNRRTRKAKNVLRERHD